MPSENFATCIGCIDGRIQLPVIYWIKKFYGVEYVDMITLAGVDGKLADEKFDINEILEELDISIVNHHASVIFLVGHYDCAGNPGDFEHHKTQLGRGIERIKKIVPDLEVTGLWVSKDWQVEKLNID